MARLVQGRREANLKGLKLTQHVWRVRVCHVVAMVLNTVICCSSSSSRPTTSSCLSSQRTLRVLYFLLLFLDASSGPAIISLEYGP